MNQSSTSRHTSFLIIGAGPFGLGIARHAKAHGVDHVIVGQPMSFWRNNIPSGMLLRSGVDWHLDPLGELTFETFAAERGLHSDDLCPLGVSPYLAYASWFQQRAGLEVTDATITSLGFNAEPHLAGGRFRAQLGDGEVITADNVVLAIGFHSFAHVPPELAACIPATRRAHTRDFVDFSAVGGQRVAIVGGRQSAFEWAALMQEAGAAAVHVIYRHDTPAFSASDWSWVDEMLDKTERQPGWWRQLPEAERARIAQAFWAEGRLKLEPWLAPRVEVPSVTLWPRSAIADSHTTNNDTLTLDLVDDAGTPRETIAVDQVALATGYQVDMARVRFLETSLREQLRVTDGSPVLGPYFRSSVPGLYVASMPAARDFGPFLGFTVSVPATSRIIGGAVHAAIAW